MSFSGRLEHQWPDVGDFPEKSLGPSGLGHDLREPSGGSSRKVQSPEDKR